MEMGNYFHARMDLIKIFNQARFFLRHYAKGYYPVKLFSGSLPVNRLFFPLENPDGKENFMQDAENCFILTPGKMYFIPAYLPIKMRLTNSLLFFSIQTNVELIPGVEFFSGCRKMLEIRRPECFEELHNILLSPPSSEYFDALRAGSLIYDLQTSLLKYYAVEDFESITIFRIYKELLEYLQKNGNGQTSVSELAAFCGQSRENFTRTFKKNVHFPPKKLIDRFVIHKSLSLLASDLTLKEISERLAFSNEFAFSRYFKRNVGESPKNWKKHIFFYEK